MKLLYYRSPKGNFGDDLNPWFWSHVLPGWASASPKTTLVGIGTLINGRRLPDITGAQYLIIGAGAGYGSGTLPILNGRARWDVRGVRGPISAKKLGLGREKILVDPAMIIPDILAGPDKKGSDVIVVPHHSSVNFFDWDSACGYAGMHYCSPEDDYVTVVEKIAGASLVVAESMHAAIIADAFRVPWVPFRLSPRFNREKWLDSGGAIDLQFDIPHISPGLEEIIEPTRGRGKMSMRLRKGLSRRLPKKIAGICGPEKFSDFW